VQTVSGSFTGEPDKPTLLNNNKPIRSIQFDAITVMKKLKRLKPEKSSGQDGIHPTPSSIKYWSNQDVLFNFNANLIGTGSLPICM